MIISIKRGVRSFAIDQLRSKSLGIPASVLTRLLGAKTVSRKISSICGYVPRIVEVDLPENLADQGRFVMSGGGGLEPVARTLQWSGEKLGYERPLPDLFAALSRDSLRVLDVGAFSGFYSLIAATCSPKAEIYAFEPQPEPRSLLDANVAQNRLGDRVHVVPIAVSDKAGTAELFVPVTKSGLVESASSLSPRPAAVARKMISVPLIDLDSFLAERKFGPVDLIKMDVEAHEPQALRGALRILREDRPIIFLEILNRCDTDTLEEIRRSNDYCGGVLLPDGVQWKSEVRHQDESNDHVLCPREKLDMFRRAVELAGFRIIQDA